MADRAGRNYRVPSLDGSDEADVPKWMQYLAVDIGNDVGAVSTRVKALEDAEFAKPRGLLVENFSNSATSSGSDESAMRAQKVVTFPPRRRYLVNYRAAVRSSVNGGLVRGYVYLRWQPTVNGVQQGPAFNLARISKHPDSNVEDTASDWFPWSSPSTVSDRTVAMFAVRFSGTPAFVMDSARWAIYDMGGY